MSDGPTILCADDDEDIISLIALRLGRAGYDVITTTDGQTALALARERKPRIAVLDVMMPRLGGLEVVAEVRADPELREMGLILLSARVQQEDIRRGLDAGADAYLVKPFRFGELEAEIVRLVGR